jgi:hypothetical protein
MKPVDPIIEIYPFTRPQPSRPVEKPSQSSSLEEDRQRAARPTILNARIKPQAKPSRCETSSSVAPSTEGIPTGFIAQILGQVLATKKPDVARRARAYEEAGRDRAEIRPIGWV